MRLYGWGKQIALGFPMYSWGGTFTMAALQSRLDDHEVLAYKPVRVLTLNSEGPDFMHADLYFRFSSCSELFISLGPDPRAESDSIRDHDCGEPRRRKPFARIDASPAVRTAD